jgi:hypothetical protein
MTYIVPDYKVEIVEDESPKDESKAKGGFARAAALSPEERKNIARKAAESRWSKDIPKATHEGVLHLGALEIPCAVLEGGQRVITQSGFMKALGRARQAKGRQYYDADVNLPAFLTAKNLKPFISPDLLVTSSQIEFRTSRGAKAFGYPAELMPKVCDVFLDAEEAGALVHSQKHIAAKAKVLMRGLAHVGIIALVDEATGYQYDRAREALAEILERFISKELRKWVKTFPDEFYEHLFRLKGWKMSDIPNRRPVIFGRITNDIVYERLAPKVLDELKRLTPRDNKGRLRDKLFQRLTEDVGHPKLREHLASEITLMRIFEDGEWDAFYKALNKALPKQTKLPLFDGLEEELSYSAPAFEQA